jgi:hypothetical protein
MFFGIKKIFNSNRWKSPKLLDFALNKLPKYRKVSALIANHFTSFFYSVLKYDSLLIKNTGTGQTLVIS